MVLALSLFFIYNEYFNESNLDFERCRQSILVRANSPEIKNAGISWLSFKEDFPLKCKTKVVEVDEKEVDEHNIFQATMKGMHKAVDELIVTPEYILVDGDNFHPYFNKDTGKQIYYQCVIGGDDTYTCIAGASIFAKVERDKYIEELCKNNPDMNLDEKYGLLSNKGYGTKQHMLGIQQYGITKWHRKSFGPCKGY